MKRTTTLLTILLTLALTALLITGCTPAARDAIQEEAARAAKEFADEGIGAVGADTRAPADSSAPKNLIDHPTGTVAIASWNIQTFGMTKAEDPERLEIIAQTILQFDFVAIQEIRDSSGEAIQLLEKALDNKIADCNDTGCYTVDWAYTIGPRLGRSSSKEQYAFLYRTDKFLITPGTEPYTYDDPQDIFHREPYIACFTTLPENPDAFDFCAVNIHVDPDEASIEIDNLADVIYSMQQTEPDSILIGDMNAGCDYWTPDPLSPLTFPGNNWLINDNADTNLAGSRCAYDRIIITNTALEDYQAGTADVFHFDEAFDLTYDQAKRISDHYPVYAIFDTNSDSD